MAGQRTYGSGLIRDVELLQVLAMPEAATAGMGVSRIAEVAGRDKGQVSRALNTLAEAELVARDPETKAYRPGWRLFSLATHSLETHLAHLATPCLRKVVSGLNETTHLCVLRGGKVITLRSELGSHAFRGVAWEGTAVNPYTTSAGRTLMSEWDDDTLARWWELFPHETSAPPTPTAIPERSYDKRQQPEFTLRSLSSQLRRIRRAGYATIDEEFEPGLVGVSAPVYDFRGDIVAAINVSAPKQRLGKHLTVAGEYTRTVADELSVVLGAPERE